MSAGARTAPADPSAAGPAGGGPPDQTADPAGRVLSRLTVLPALLVMAWLLAGLPLLFLGLFTPVLMLVVSVPLAIVLVVLALRWSPSRPQAGPLLTHGSRAAESSSEQPRPRTPWWAVAGVVAVAIAFGVDKVIYHSQQIIVNRDPASYIQFANWIAHHHSLPIPPDAAAFGGSHHVLSFASFAFYQVGHTVVPQFMAGLPMILSAGFWLGGVAAAVAMGSVLGALAVLTFGGLAARLIGARWAPLAALVLALALPEQFTSRATYSEPLVQILFLGGLCLLVDSFADDGIGVRVMAALAGLALGLTLLVRIDGASYMLPVLPYCGLLLVTRRVSQGIALLGGLAVGAIYGVADGLLLSRPYLASIKSSLIPLVLVVAVVAIATVAAVALLWRRGLPEVRGNWLPNAAAAAAFVILAVFYFRPYVQTARGGASKFTLSVIAGFQRGDHLRPDPTRLYYEISLHWVQWYIGLPAVVLGTLAAAVLARRCLRGQAPTWTLPLMIFAWTIVATLYRPAITPDQPWASRRLVPAVLPGFILLAVWATSWLVGWLRRRGAPRVAWAGLGAVCTAALVVPAVITTFGIVRSGHGPLGLKPAAVGLADKRTYGGEIAAVGHLCAAIPSRASVVFVDSSTGTIGNNFAEVVRGMCGVPTAIMSTRSPSAAQVVVAGIRRAGRTPVFLAPRPRELTPYGGTARLIMTLQSAQDGHALVTAPKNTTKLAYHIWMSEP